MCGQTADSLLQLRQILGSIQAILGVRSGGDVFGLFSIERPEHGMLPAFTPLGTHAAHHPKEPRAIGFGRERG